jgi:serine/threonine protein kinase
MISPYRLCGRLGSGEMGFVHLAEDPNGRQVALKLVLPPRESTSQYRHDPDPVRQHQ